MARRSFMNPAEQRSHKNVTDNLRADFKQLSDDFDVTSEHNRVAHQDMQGDVALALRRIVDLQQSRATHEELSAVLDQTGAVALDHRAFVLRGFWARLNWLITGR
jgi:hypothetical protein